MRPATTLRTSSPFSTRSMLQCRRTWRSTWWPTTAPRTSPGPPRPGWPGHPRFHVHHTPPHASWLNQVALFFSILARRLLKHGDFLSRADLVAKLIAFIADYDATAGPFKWTYDGRPLKAA